MKIFAEKSAHDAAVKFYNYLADIIQSDQLTKLTTADLHQFLTQMSQWTRDAMSAVEKNDVEYLKKLQTRGFSLHVRDADGNNLLHHAVRYKSLLALQWLEQHAPTLKTKRNQQGKTPLALLRSILHYQLKMPALKKQLDTLQPLNLTKKDTKTYDFSQNHSPSMLPWLIFFIQQQQPNQMKLLLKQGHNIRERDHEGQTALHHAINKVDLWSIYFLAKYGASFKTEDLQGKSVSTLIANSPSQLLIECLLLTLRTESEAALLYYAEKGNLAKLKYIVIRDQINLATFDKSGRNALHHAIAHKRYEVIEYLLQKSKQQTTKFNHNFVNHQDQLGLTPLHLAICLEFVDALMPLLKHHSCLANTRAKSGKTPLHSMADNIKAHDRLEDKARCSNMTAASFAIITQRGAHFYRESLQTKLLLLKQYQSLPALNQFSPDQLSDYLLQNWVIISVRLPNYGEGKFGNYGHAFLQTAEFFISLYAAQDGGVAMFPSEKEGPVSTSIVLYSLDAKAINLKYQKLHQDIENRILQYGLARKENQISCARLTLELLEAGGIRQLCPNLAKSFLSTSINDIESVHSIAVKAQQQEIKRYGSLNQCGLMTPCSVTKSIAERGRYRQDFGYDSSMQLRATVMKKIKESYLTTNTTSQCSLY